MTTKLLLLLTLLTLGSHAMWLGGPFLSDDFGIILDVVDQGEPSLARALDGFVRPLPGVEAPLPQEFAARFWRPMWRLSLYLDLRLWGADSFGFLLTNVLLHLGSVLLLFSVGRRMGLGLGVAWTAAALFAVHPSHHEAIPWIAARCGPLAVLFSLLSAELLLASVQRGERVDLRRAAGAALALLAALLSKENALVFPATAGALLLLAPAAMGRARRLVALLPMVALFGLYLIARHHMLGELVGGYAGLQGEGLGATFWSEQLAKLSALLGPARSDAVGVVAQRGLAAAVALFGFVGVALIALRQRSSRPAVAAAGLWLLLSLAPTWQLAVSPADHEAIRFLYEPAAPLALLLALAGEGLVGLVPTQSLRTKVAAALVAVALAASVALLVFNAGPRRAANELADRLYDEVRTVIARNPGAFLVFVELPWAVDGVSLAQNALPYLARPPFGEHVVEVKVFYDTAYDRQRFRQIPPDVRQGPGVRIFAWEAATRVLLPIR